MIRYFAVFSCNLTGTANGTSTSANNHYFTLKTQVLFQDNVARERMESTLVSFKRSNVKIRQRNFCREYYIIVRRSHLYSTSCFLFESLNNVDVFVVTLMGLFTI